MISYDKVKNYENFENFELGSYSKYIIMIDINIPDFAILILVENCCIRNALIRMTKIDMPRVFWNCFQPCQYGIQLVEAIKMVSMLNVSSYQKFISNSQIITKLNINIGNLMTLERSDIYHQLGLEFHLHSHGFRNAISFKISLTDRPR